MAGRRETLGTRLTWNREFKQTGMTATAMRMSLNKRLNEQYNSSACVLSHFGTFLSRPLQNNNVKSPNSWFLKNVNHNSEFFKFLFGFECCLNTYSAEDSSDTDRQTE